MKNRFFQKVSTEYLTNFVLKKIIEKQFKKINLNDQLLLVELIFYD